MQNYYYWLLFALSLAACQSPGPSTPTPPNFVFFLVDDMGWTDLGCYGSTFYETPNIDRLAASGVRFTDAYAACPVCSPTRASIMSGKYPARLKVTDWIPGRQANHPSDPGQKMLSRPFALQMALEEVTIAEALQEAGYQTFFAGKWHIGEDSAYWPEHQGFAINKGGHSKGSPPGGYFSPYDNPRLTSGPEGEYLTDRLGDESVRFLETTGPNPFLLYLSFYTVHNPMQGKDSLVQKYEQKAAGLGYTEADRFRTDAPWIRTAPPRGNFRERRVQDHPTYASMVESLDQNVGKVLDKLSELGLAENTVVIFMSDNGGLATAEGSPTTNLPLRAGKGWLYEGGIREPMIIRWPGGQDQAGLTCSTPVTSTDFYPTILEMAGLPARPTQHQDGESLVPLLKGKTDLNREALFWHYPHYANQGGLPGSVIRAGRYKLIEQYGEAPELYDLQTDLEERHNLAATEPDRVQELSARLQAWRESVGAEGMDPNPDYDAGYVRGDSK